MNLRFFFAVSVSLHIMIILGVLLFPFQQQPGKKDKPLITRLVTPEELSAKKKEPEKKPRPAPNVKIVQPKPLPRVRVQPPAPKEAPKQMPKPPRNAPPPKTFEDKGSGPEAPNQLTGQKSGGERANPGEGKGSVPNKPHEPGPYTGIHHGKELFGEEMKLAEKEAIEKLTEKEGEAAPGAKGEGGDEKENGISFSTKEFKYYGYNTRLREKIEGIWVYPPEAAEKGLYGDLEIQFTILRSGKLGSVEILRTSGYKILDDAAVKALRDAAPYWPLPNEWKEDSYTIRGHFIYTLGGYYVR